MTGLLACKGIKIIKYTIDTAKKLIIKYVHTEKKAKAPAHKVQGPGGQRPVRQVCHLVKKKHQIKSNA